MDQYAQLIHNLPRLLPNFKTDSLSQKRFGVHDDTQFEKIYSYIANGLDTKETRWGCFDLWMKVDSIEMLKVLLGDPYGLEEGGEEFLPPHAHRLRALSLGLKIFGKLLSIPWLDEGAMEEGLHPMLVQELGGVWKQWFEAVFRSRFPLLRFSGFFGLRQAFLNPCFASWFCKKTQAISIFVSAILDDSAYVKELCCQLVSDLVHRQSSLSTTDAYFSIVEEMKMIFRQNQYQVLNVRMEVAWALANRAQAPFSKEHAERFLLESGFLEGFWGCWRDSERRARDQASETIFRLFGSFDSNLIFGLFTRGEDTVPSLNSAIGSILNSPGDFVVGLRPTEEDGLSALGLISALAGIMDDTFNEVASIQESLIEIHVQLLCILIPDPVFRAHLRQEVFKVEFDFEQIEYLVWNATCAQRFELVYSLLAGLHKLTCRDFLTNADLMARVINGHLTGSSICDGSGSVAPMKLLRLGLDVLRNGLRANLERPCLEKTFHGITLRLLLDAGLDAPAFGAVLKCMQEGLHLVTEGKELAEALQRRAYDLQWAARDSVAEFIGQVLSGQRLVFRFALDHSLHEILIQAVGDAEPYVRATAYQSLARLVANSQLPPDFVLNVETALHESGKLRFSLEPGEFQRSPHLSLLVALLSFHTRHLELEMPSCFPIDRLNKLAFDGDSEVIIQAIYLIYAWWKYEWTKKTSHQSKRPKLERSSSDFFTLKLHDLLISKLEDSSRIVRQVAINVILQLQQDCRTIPECWVQDTQGFLGTIASLDLPRLQRNCDPQILYPDSRDLEHLIMPSPESSPQRTKVNVSKAVDDSGWFTSDSEPVDEEDTEDYNVMDCF